MKRKTWAELSAENKRLRAWLKTLRVRLARSEERSEELAREASRAVFAEQDLAKMKEVMADYELEMAKHQACTKHVVSCDRLKSDDYAAVLSPHLRP